MQNTTTLYTRRSFLSCSAAAAVVASRAHCAFAEALGQQATQSLASQAFAGLETRKQLTPEQIDAAARNLLAKLTLEQKIQLMSGDREFYAGYLRLMCGEYNRLPVNTAGAMPQFGIPGVRFTDGPRGVMLPGATTFPVAMARGASFDPQLEERVGDAMGREARAYGANMIGAPCINLLRHPAWGRAQETYGEDSHHLGEMGSGLTRGIQRHVMSCAKHFCLNSIEDARFQVDVTADARTLREVYLPHFKRLVDSGVASVMSSYNSVNGEWAGQNRTLLHDILKKEWGFQGYLQSDWLWGMRDAKKAALAGQNVEMPFRNLFHRYLLDLVRRGEVPSELVDDAGFRILRQEVRFSQGRNPEDYKPEVIGCEAHRALAREVAQKSIVLLKNEGDLLPLKNVQTIAVIGRLADTSNTGDHGSSWTQPAYVVTPLEGLRSAADGSFAVLYEDGQDHTRAANLAKMVDVVICVVGYTYVDEGEYVPAEDGPWNAHFPKPAPEQQPLMRHIAEAEAVVPASFAGDRSSLQLHPEDEKLIEAIAAANPRTIVAMMGGSAVITENWRDKPASILMLWYPGMEGGHAFADVLLGRVNPSGKLPCVFPRRAEDLPFFDPHATKITYDLWHGYRKLERDKVVPAFPFGFGLSYTTFSLDNLALGRNRIATNGTLAVTAELTNTGAHAGEEVVQLYIGARTSKVPRAPKELKAFTKVPLAPHEKQAIHFSLPAMDLAYYDEEKGWVVEPGEYEVMVARHSQDERALSARVVVT